MSCVEYKIWLKYYNKHPWGDEITYSENAYTRYVLAAVNGSKNLNLNDFRLLKDLNESNNTNNNSKDEITEEQKIRDMCMIAKMFGGKVNPKFKDIAEGKFLKTDNNKKESI